MIIVHDNGRNSNSKNRGYDINNLNNNDKFTSYINSSGIRNNQG